LIAKTTFDMPFVSVLMPVYNGEKHLREAIQSILNQSFSDFELLIINDASTDASEQIILSFDDPRIRYDAHATNLGLPATLNKGIEMCKEKYIFRMDQDDQSLPERLQTQIDFMEQNPEIALCGSWIKVFGLGNEEVWHYPTKHPYIQCAMLFRCPFAHPSLVLRKDVFIRQNLRYDPSFRYAEDYDLWVRIADQVRMANIPKVLLHYRLHETQMSKTAHNTVTSIPESIKKKLLDTLGVHYEEADFQLHLAIGWDRWENVEILTLHRMVDWLCKLWKANRKKKQYPSDIFTEVLFWQGLMPLVVQLKKEQKWTWKARKMAFLNPLSLAYAADRMLKKVRNALEFIS
jgi:glycosyltransferase involved in cell wall biosynthesis